MKKKTLDEQFAEAGIKDHERITREYLATKKIETNKAYQQGKIDILEELIAIFKPRDPKEQYTTNVILLELDVRLRMIKAIK